MSRDIATILKESKEARKYYAQNDIRFFAKFYLSKYIKTNVGPLHAEWISMMLSAQNVAIAAPRGHGKSLWFSLVYILWCILFEKKSFIILISDTSTQSEELLGTIIEELETNDTIIRDFGRIAGYAGETREEKTKWTSRDIVTLTGIKVMARGWKSKLRGLRYKEKRPDLIILDDVENDENVLSEDQRAKVKNVFYKSILNLGDVTTQIMVVGTILHYDALLASLITNKPRNFHVKLYRAIENGEPIWPEWWSLERLREKREQVGSIAFEQEYMNNPLDPSTQILKPTSFFDRLSLNELEQMDYFAAIDLAISEKETADYTAIVTIGKNRESGKIYVIDVQRFRGNVSTQIEMVFNKFAQYKWKIFGVETVAYQKAFYQILINESMKRGIYLPVREIKADGDKVRRAMEISPHVENGAVYFCNRHMDFMAEIQQFPKGAHDDMVDAFVYALKFAITGGTGKLQRFTRSMDMVQSFG